MFAGLPSLSHEQQQKAVERIQELMSQGITADKPLLWLLKSYAPVIPASGSWRVLKMKTNNAA